MNSEAAFLFSTFQEFYKCWIFSKRTYGDANVNFLAFLGHKMTSTSNQGTQNRNVTESFKRAEEVRK